MGFAGWGFSFQSGPAGLFPVQQMASPSSEGLWAGVEFGLPALPDWNFVTPRVVG